MKRLILFIFLLKSVSSIAQVSEFQIQGIIQHTDQAKFAYLSTLSHQIPVSSSQIFMVVPILNGKFEFNGTFDLEGKPYQHACVILDERGNISKEELASKFKQLVWIIGREKNIKNIILENLKVNIERYDQINTAKIVENGVLTKQFDEEQMAVKAGNKQLVEFVKKYPDSPISFNTVKTVNNLIDPYDRDRLESAWGSATELYSLLSDRLKGSKDGLALKKSIDKKAKLK